MLRGDWTLLVFKQYYYLVVIAPVATLIMCKLVKPLLPPKMVVDAKGVAKDQ